VAWAATLAWGALIWNLGGSDFSMSRTSGVLLPWLRWWLPGAEPALLETLHFLVRKLAHAAEYGVFAGLSFIALRTSAPQPSRLPAPAALALCLALSLCDEVRQAGTGVREGSAADVALDFAGGVLALGLLWTFARKGSGKRPRASGAANG